MDYKARILTLWKDQVVIMCSRKVFRMCQLVTQENGHGRLVTYIYVSWMKKWIVVQMFFYFGREDFVVPRHKIKHWRRRRWHIFTSVSYFVLQCCTSLHFSALEKMKCLNQKPLFHTKKRYVLNYCRIFEEAQSNFSFFLKTFGAFGFTFKKAHIFS